MYISVAGTVGVGKTTLTKTLAQNLGFTGIYENVSNNPYFSDYYNDFGKWAYQMQLFFLVDRIKKQLLEIELERNIITDRSFYEDMEIFTKTQYEKGFIAERDFITYKTLYESIKSTPYFKSPDLLIYLYGDIEKILYRLQQRARQVEVEISDNYWKDLNSRYNLWIESFSECPVIKINIDDYDCFNQDSVQSLILQVSNGLNGNFVKK